MIGAVAVAVSYIVTADSPMLACKTEVTLFSENACENENTAEHLIEGIVQVEMRIHAVKHLIERYEQSLVLFS